VVGFGAWGDLELAGASAVCAGGPLGEGAAGVDGDGGGGGAVAEAAADLEAVVGVAGVTSEVAGLDGLLAAAGWAGEGLGLHLEAVVRRMAEWRKRQGGRGATSS
jgi:hypothetical protein